MYVMYVRLYIISYIHIHEMYLWYRIFFTSKFSKQLLQITSGGGKNYTFILTV